MKKAKFTSHGGDAVTLEYTDIVSGVAQCRTFIQRGSYVYELIGQRGTERQVCKKLASHGETLMCTIGVELMSKIRAEYRKMKAFNNRVGTT